MSRTTQFIGLTNAAQEFVEGRTELPSDRQVLGMFMESIPLRRWDASDIADKDSACIREKEQVTYWSSGPMIFTCLEIDYGNGGYATVYEWVHDPRLKNEYNPESGRLWV